ncbi:hypothetical protein C8Q79DRAFT_687440 [Trametes meyenii]|nr:hypothetical protein C8Q79DRAFT_687440 [Trametes meyenii]
MSGSMHALFNTRAKPSGPRKTIPVAPDPHLPARIVVGSSALLASHQSPIDARDPTRPRTPSKLPSARRTTRNNLSLAYASAPHAYALVRTPPTSRKPGSLGWSGPTFNAHRHRGVGSRGARHGRTLLSPDRLLPLLPAGSRLTSI